MDPHRIDVFNGADDDAIVRRVANNFHLVFFPAKQAFINQHLRHRRGCQARAHNFLILFAIISNTPASAAQRKGRTNDRRQANIVENINSHLQTGNPVINRLAVCIFTLRGLNDLRAWVLQPDPVHGLAEQLPVLSHFNRFSFRPDQLDTIPLKHASFLQVEGTVQRRLPAHGREQCVWFFTRNNLFHKVRRDRLNIGRIRQIRVSHNRGRVGIHQNNPVAFIFERFDRLHTGIVKLTGLTDNNRPCTND